eukprot:jgi/Chrzof1/2378/Cz11g12260.t1
MSLLLSVGTTCQALASPEASLQQTNPCCINLPCNHILTTHMGLYAAEDGSFLSQFFSSTAAMSPQERGAFLEQPPSGAPDIEEAHQVGAVAGWWEAVAKDFLYLCSWP